MARLQWIALASLTLLGCGDDEASPGAEAAEPSAPRPSADDGLLADEPEVPARVRFDLARHASRAELWHGDARVMELGTARGHQHTLGGWRTRVGQTHDFADPGAGDALVLASVVRGVTGYFLLPLTTASRNARWWVFRFRIGRQ